MIVNDHSDVTDILAELTGPFVQGHALRISKGFGQAIALRDAEIVNVDFSGTRFSREVVFERCVFRGLSWFRNCRFDAGVRFSGSRFLNDARFDAASFGDEVDFEAADGRGVMCFDHVQVAGPLKLRGLTSYGNLSFDRARVLARADLREVTCLGGLWAVDAAFEGEVLLDDLEVHGRTWLRGSRFASSAMSRGVARQIGSLGYQAL